jgi:hypothetical protein
MNATEEVGMRIWINQGSYREAMEGKTNREAEEEIERAVELMLTGRIADLPIWAALSSDEGPAS